MADAEQVARLLRSVDEWNAWRVENPNVHVDLSQAELFRGHIPGAILNDADLAWAGLHGLELSGAMLAGANLAGADLRGAKLGDVNLVGANLKVANLTRAMLNATNLSRASLSRTNLDGAFLLSSPGCTTLKIPLCSSKRQSV